MDLAFQCYETGKYVPPTKPFDVEFGGEASDDYLHDTVLPMLRDNPDSWKMLMETARAHAGISTVQRPRVVKSHATRKRNRRITADSSSPVRGD